MTVFVLNCGSSSVKAQLIDLDTRTSVLAAKVDRIGESTSHMDCRQRTEAGGWTDKADEVRASDHRTALELMFATLAKHSAVFQSGKFAAIGHRVVHGGSKFSQPAVLDEAVVEAIRAVAALAPLHNGANLAGIELARKRWPAVPQVAVFDTAFHQTMPPHAFHYALPLDLCEKFGIRRYGFHGTSHRYVARRAAALLNRPLESLRLITLHLGNGASAAAIDSGRCVDTTMGFTPLEGLMMSTRSGDIDPAIVFHLHRTTGMSLDELETMLKSQSGLKGICGASDMRDVERMAKAGDAHAELALAMFCYRVKKCIGAYFAALGRVDALVFTGGIGENSAEARRRSCLGLEALGIALDDTRNSSTAADEREVNIANSAVKAFVIPTNEELEIAEQTVALIQSAPPTGSEQ